MDRRDPFGRQPRGCVALTGEDEGTTGTQVRAEKRPRVLGPAVAERCPDVGPPDNDCTDLAHGLGEPKGLRIVQQHHVAGMDRFRKPFCVLLGDPR